MNVRHDFPHAIRTIEHTWITLEDGTRLAARIWLPESAEKDPVPALLEYLPYRKNDGTVVRDALRHPWFAGHGYASVRVDMRGSGDSDGFLTDEYLPLEQSDGLEVLRWIATQPWCTGRVGMFGKSWGGFNSLQIAAHRPPELGGIITLCSTDDRYADDVHYKGGCVLGEKMLYWSSTMLAYDARPPDPHLAGDGWHEKWLERLEAIEPSVARWLEHQHRDAYWQQGSVCEDFSAITCPVYAVGGWADGYSDAVFRLLEGLTCPRKGMVGSWAHNFPEEGLPGPAIGFLQESLRWWDWCLKGEEAGILGGPDLSIWIQDGTPFYKNRTSFPGAWYETTWTGPGGHALLYPAQEEGQCVLASKVGAGSVDVRTDQDVGVEMGNWCSYGAIEDFAGDQTTDDARSSCFDSPTLSSEMVLLGFPVVKLRLSTDVPTALVAARLCDVAPDGTSSLVSWGILNLAHRRSHAHPTPLVQDESEEIVLRLKAIGYRIKAGHRWRLAISSTCWPFAWPSPATPTLRVDLSASRLELPLGEGLAPVAFLESEVAEPLVRTILQEGTRSREVVVGETTEVRSIGDSGTFRLVDGQRYGEQGEDVYRISPQDPLSAETTSLREIEVGREGWDVAIRVWSRMTADAEYFHVENQLRVTEDSRTLLERAWAQPVRRDLG